MKKVKRYSSGVTSVKTGQCRAEISRKQRFICNRLVGTYRAKPVNYVARVASGTWLELICQQNTYQVSSERLKMLRLSGIVITNKNNYKSGATTVFTTTYYLLVHSVSPL